MPKELKFDDIMYKLNIAIDFLDEIATNEKFEEMENDINREIRELQEVREYLLKNEEILEDNENV